MYFSTFDSAIMLFFLYQTLDGVINRLLNMNNWYEIFVILFTNMPPYFENDTR